MEMELSPHPDNYTRGNEGEDLDEGEDSDEGEDERNPIKVIKLEDCFRTKTEYDGVKAMLVYCSFIIVTGLFVGLFFHPGDTVSKSEAVQGLAYYTDSSGADQAFTDVATVQDLMTYAIGLSESILENSIDLNYAKEACYLSSTPIKKIVFTWTVPKSLDIDSDLSGGVDISTLTCENTDGVQKCTFLVYNGPDFDRSQSLTNLEDFDSSYLSVFDQDLLEFQGNFLTQNPITKTEGMLTTLGNQFGDATMTTGSFSTLSLYAATPQRMFRLLFEILFLVGAFIVTKDEIDDMRWASRAMHSSYLVSVLPIHSVAFQLFDFIIQVTCTPGVVSLIQ